MHERPRTHTSIAPVIFHRGSGTPCSPRIEVADRERGRIKKRTTEREEKKKEGKWK